MMYLKGALTTLLAVSTPWSVSFWRPSEMAVKLIETMGAEVVVEEVVKLVPTVGPVNIVNEFPFYMVNMFLVRRYCKNCINSTPRFC